MAVVTTETYLRTRTDLHRLAEHVVSATLNRESGHVALRAVEGGFGTPEFGSGRTISVVGAPAEGVVLVDDEGGARRVARVDGTSLAELAAFVRAEAGSPDPQERWTTPLDADQPLRVDPEAAAVVAGCHALGDAALRAWSDEIAGEEPSAVKLWPEHFDIAISAGEVNYGASPGDEGHQGPYLYVGPWSGRPEQDHDFWNAPFGALLAVGDGMVVDDAVAFFRAGRARLAT